MHSKFVKNHSLWKNLRNLNTTGPEVQYIRKCPLSPPPIAASLIIPANNTVCRKILVKNHSLGKYPSTVPPRLLNIMLLARPS